MRISLKTPGLLGSALCFLLHPLAHADRFYVSSAGNDIIELYDSDGSGSVFADSGLGSPEGLAFDNNGTLYVANFNSSTITKFDSKGHGTLFASSGLNQPIGLAFDGSGNLYAANWGDNTIEKFDSAGTPSVFANSGVSHPYGLAFDTNGNLFVSNQGNNTIMKYDTNGVGTLFASSGLNFPSGLAFDKTGNLYVANPDGPNNGWIQKFDPLGNGSLFASSGLASPGGLAFDSSGYLYAVNYSGTIERFDSGGNGSVFASAGLNHPAFIVIGPGNVRAKVIQILTFSLTAFMQGTNYDNGTSTIGAPPKLKSYNTADLLKVLAEDEYAAGNWPSNTFPSTAKLAFGDIGFAVLSGTNVLVNVLDILRFQTGDNEIRSGKRNDATGLATPNVKRLRLEKITFDDTSIHGGIGLKFFIQGLLSESETDTVPRAAGVYTQTTIGKITDGTGEGIDSDGNTFVLKGTVTLTGHGTLVLPP